MNAIPQWIYLILLLLTVLVSAAKHGQPKSNWDAWAAGIGFIIEFALLWWGGFWAPIFR